MTTSVALSSCTGTDPKHHQHRDEPGTTRTKDTVKITKKFIAAGTAGILSAGGIGLAVASAPAASAATSSPSTTATGVTGRLQAIKDALAGLVGDGTITQTQADKVASTLDDSPALRGGGHGGGRLVDLDTAATTLGMTSDELRTALQADAATLATVAKSKGVDEQKLIDALVASAKTHLTEEVTEGDLTQAQADTKNAALPTTVKQAVESQFRGGRGDHDGDGVPATGSSTSSSTSGSAATAN